MAARRLFFALWPDDSLRHALYHWQMHHLRGDLRWQHRADLHLTLHFLGAVASDKVGALIELGDGVGGESFTLVLDRIGHWPRPQVLWAGPQAAPDALGRLHARLADGLLGLGFAPEQRRYRPHVTLARRVRGSPDPLSFPALTWRVAEFALVESCPGDAPHYQPIARWALG